jgi:hypothetical protein
VTQPFGGFVQLVSVIPDPVDQHLRLVGRKRFSAPTL